MITIGAILAEYGLTLADIAEFAPWAVQLGEAYEATRNYVNFTNAFFQAFPGSRRTTADLVWRIGKYWFEQGSALSQIDPSQVIPRQLARVSSKATDTLGLFSQYNYTVTTTFTDPRTGSTQHYSTIVTSETPLSLDEAYEAAYDIALNNIVSYDPFAADIGFYTDIVPSQSLYSFVRYEQGP